MADRSFPLHHQSTGPANAPVDRMGFGLPRSGAVTLVCVYIDNSLSNKPPGSWLGHLFGTVNARWFTRQMVMGSARHLS